jgi:hypothetical protein
MKSLRSLTYLILAFNVFAFAGEGATSFTEMDAGLPLLQVPETTNHKIASPQQGLAALTYYSSRAAFDADAPDIALEDFEGGMAAPGQVVGCGSPLESSSSPCFGAGVIEAGLEVHALSETNIVALGPGIVPINPTTWVGSDLFNDVTFLDFTNGDAYAVGLDVFDFFGSSTISVQVFSASGLIGTSLAISGGFWGVISDEPITRVVLGVSSNVIVLDNVAFGNPVVDTDGDGIPDDEDSCPNSDLADTIVIGGCDSGVANVLLDGGCTISDLIDECAAGAANHGQFVSCVSHLTNELKNEGVISGRDKGKIMSCAARAN